MRDSPDTCLALLGSLSQRLHALIERYHYLGHRRLEIAESGSITQTPALDSKGSSTGAMTVARSGWISSMSFKVNGRRITQPVARQGRLAALTRPEQRQGRCAREPALQRLLSKARNISMHFDYRSS